MAEARLVFSGNEALYIHVQHDISTPLTCIVSLRLNSIQLQASIFFRKIPSVVL